MWPKRRPYFQIERNGEPIESHHVKHGVNPNITKGSRLPNLVPIFEEQEALRYANYNYGEWKVLPYWEKALHVAHYRYSRLIRLHGNDAINDRLERDMKIAQQRSKPRQQN